MAITNNDFSHDHLIEQIRAVGQELIRDAEKFVPDMEHITSFSIEVNFPIPSRSGIPEITTMAGVTSGKYIEDIIEVDGKYASKVYKSHMED